MQVPTTTEWAREHGTRMQFTCAMDNYEPVPRNHAAGELFVYDRDDELGIVIVDALDKFPRAPRCLFVVDDGRSAQVFYVAAWHDEQRHVIAHTMPMNYDREGNQRTRASDGLPVDFRHWQLGPMTAYHLKVRAAD